MRIDLNTTKGEIKRYNLSNNEPLDVFKIINICQNNNWYFTIEFDDKNNNVLKIKSGIDINKDILFNMLDGRIPSIYLFPEMHIKIDGKCFYSKNISSDTNHLKDIFIEFNEEEANFEGNIKLVGFPSIAILQKKMDMTKWIHENTWLGSLKYFDKKYYCEIIVFGKKYFVETRKKGELSSDCPVFKNSYSITANELFIGDLYILIDPKSDEYIFRHSKYGVFNIESIDKYFWKKINKFKIGGIEIEIDVTNYEMFTNVATYDKSKMLEIVNILFAIADNISNSNEYLRYKKELDIIKKTNTAREITKRQERAESNKKVFVDGKMVMSQPTCENELVSLYMKLEAAKKLPFECNVFEYTKKQGIDALANFRFSSNEAFTRYAPVEFEFMLENYFDHGHPIEQTSLIICWDYSEEFKDITGFDFKKMEAWLIFIETGIKILPAVILKYYKKIKIS